MTKRVTDMTRRHQPGQAVFKSILPEDIDWQAFLAFPPAVPHRHPEDRIYTVMSGVFYIGLGDAFDETKLVAYPPGSVIVLPGDTPHFHWAKSGEYVTQVTAIGPLGLEYMSLKDVPRN